MAGSKGGGGGKGGSVTPVGGGYGGGNQYGTGYYNPQPQLSQMLYNPMMDVYGSSQNVMQPMPGYYNQYPAGGSNYQPYQPQPIYEPTPMPDPPPAPNPGTGPIGGQGGNTGLPIGLEPGTDFNNYNMNDIANAVTQSTFGNYQPVYANPQPMYQNNFQQYTAPAQGSYQQPRPDGYPMSQNNYQSPGADAPTGSGNHSMGQMMAQGVSNTMYLPQPGNDGQGFVSNQQPSGAANAFGYQPTSQALQGPGMPVAPSQQVQMPILDAASNPGFGGYDQNARATMYAPPMYNFGGYY
jgi:hypothetical protein